MSKKNNNGSRNVPCGTHEQQKPRLIKHNLQQFFVVYGTEKDLCRVLTVKHTLLHHHTCHLAYTDFKY